MSNHPNSLKNLKPFAKGVSGYTGGRQRFLPEDLKGITSLTQFQVNKLISKYAQMVLASLKEKLQDPATPVLELAVASIFEKSIRKGDFSRLAFLLDRCIGRVPDIIEDEEDLDSRVEISRLSMNELLTLVKTIPPPTESPE